MLTTTRRVFRGIFSGGLLVASLTFSGPARGQEGPIDLLSQYDFRIDGEEGAGLGRSIDTVGDMNNDGTPDMILGAQYQDGPGGVNAGSAFVVFGDPSPGTLDLTSLGTHGFEIQGNNLIERAGASVAGVGDVNNDGIPDVMVGATLASHNSRNHSGTAYVVFGKTTTTPVDLGALGAGGFQIDGAAVDDGAGYSVEGIRDLNNDGKTDLLVGAPFADNNSRNTSGSVYVVFGKSTTTSVDLASLGAGGYRIDGAAATDEFGLDLAGGRDVDDDGKPDLIAGAPYADNSAEDTAGSAYVVFGKTTTTTIDLASLGSSGFRIDGALENSSVGRAVTILRDVNGNDIPDVAVGAPTGDNDNVGVSGAAYVIFDKATTGTVDLASLGSGGFMIDHAAGNDLVGDSLAGLRDVNGDDLNDLVIGVPIADNNDRFSSGSAFVIFGKSSTTDIDIKNLGSSGYRIDGAATGDNAASAVADVGDINDDGVVDVGVGAENAKNNGRLGSGSVYIDFVADWLPGDCANLRSGTDGDDTLIGGTAGDDIRGGDGADILKGEAGDDCVGGEGGADDLFGGVNADVLTGGTEPDTLQGDDGNDTLQGEDGDDTLDGNSGGDTLDGGDNKDTLEGGDGDDMISGGGGDDTAEGNDGHDTIDGEDGKDDLKGEKATDTITGGDSADTLDGGKGDDTLEGDDGGDTLKGDLDDDLLKGNAGDDTLKGEDDKDDLKGGDGKDTIKGGDGKDTLDGGDGKDTIESGDGDDEIFANDGEKDTIDCGSGSDTVHHDSLDVLISC